MSVPILRIYIYIYIYIYNYEKRVAPPRIYFWSQDSIEDYSPTWHGREVTMNKTIVTLGTGWKELSVPLSMLRVNFWIIYCIIWAKMYNWNFMWLKIKLCKQVIRNTPSCWNKGNSSNFPGQAFTVFMLRPLHQVWEKY